MGDDSRGILTEADREFLQKDPDEQQEDYSRSAISQRRAAIRSRVYQGLQDLNFLYHNLPDRERKRIFEAFTSDITIEPRANLLRFGCAFVLLGVAEQEDRPLDDTEFYETEFYHLVEKALYKGGGISYSPSNIDVDVSIDGWQDPDKPFEGVDPTQLSEERLRMLLFEGTISNEEFARGVLSKKSNEFD